MNSCLYECAVMHARLSPRPHRFVYRIFMLAVDLDELDHVGRLAPWLSVNRGNLFSFRERDFLPVGETAFNAAPDHRPIAHSGGLKDRVIAYLGRHHINLAGGRVLLVAPLSGHFATLLRGTVRTMLPEHDVYITDWANTADVPLAHGSFDLDAYIAYIIDFLEFLGPDTHVVAVCQPSVPVLAAVSIMAADKHAACPRSMTLMGGPIDTVIVPGRLMKAFRGQHSPELTAIGTTGTPVRMARRAPPDL